MKKLVNFRTSLSKEAVITILKENTFPIEHDFKTLPFDRYYFSGQINEKRIRIKNALKKPRNPSPILEVSILQSMEGTEIVIQDDTEDDIKTNSLMIQIITISIAVVIFLVGGILSFVHPHNYSLLWTMVTSFSIPALGFLYSYCYKERVRLNTREDIGLLVNLLKR